MRLPGQAVFGVDKRDILRYRQVVPEIGVGPDYEAALEAAEEFGMMESRAEVSRRAGQYL